MTAQQMPLARITPARRAVQAAAPPAPPPVVRALSPGQKAAVIVRWLLAQGAALPLARLPDHMQAALTEEMGQLRLIDRDTLNHVVEEFTTQLDSVGLAFPGGIEGALSVMDGHISPSAASRLRRLANVSTRADPWERLVTLAPDQMLPVLESEAVEVAAVILSKLPVPRAAELLGLLPGERARRIAFAVSQTGDVDPETVRRIGMAILTQIDSQPPRAFDRRPVDRVGAILNVSAAATRDDVLAGLEAADTGFAAEVRRAIFTYAHIPQRVLPRDVTRILRLVEQPALVTAMAHALGKPDEEAASEFLLANISQRMAQALREEIAERGKVKEKEGETAAALIVGAIRQLEGMGELSLIQPEDEG